MTLCNFVSKNIIAASQMKVENRATIPPVIAISCTIGMIQVVGIQEARARTLRAAKGVDIQ